MSEHYTAATESVLRWCEKCQRLTKHAVSSGRIGRCQEHDAPLLSKRQQRQREQLARDAQNPRLF